MLADGSNHGQATVVLFSGGMDSAVLVALAAREMAVQPVYVAVGFAWEADEQAMARRLLAAIPFQERVRPLVRLGFDMRDVYPPTHWAVCGDPPAFDSPDEDVYLDGRNIVLLAKTAVFMARNGFTRVLMGQLAGNPFPDATPQFFDTIGRALSIGLSAPVAVEAPFSGLHKPDVIRRGVDLGVPLQVTLSCMQPSGGFHCGRCSKCRERRDGFREAGVADPTVYAVTPAR